VPGAQGQPKGRISTASIDRIGLLGNGCGVDQASPQFLRIAHRAFLPASRSPKPNPPTQTKPAVPAAASVEAERPVVAMLVSVFRVT
jgi:hypothetical protein